MKKILSVVMSFCILFFMPIGKVNAMETVNNESQQFAHVIIFYEDEEKADEYIDKISKVVLDYSRNVIVEEQNNFGYAYLKNVDDVYGENICVKFHKFPIQQLQDNFFGNTETNLYKILVRCCQAIIIYDINNPTLQPVINGRASCDNWKKLYEIDTPLNRFIKYTQSFGLEGWHNSLEFLTYGEDYENARKFCSELDSYTGFIEKEVFKYTTDNNKWNRGHGYFTRRFKPTLYVISWQYSRFKKKQYYIKNRSGNQRNVNNMGQKNTYSQYNPRVAQYYSGGRNDTSERNTEQPVVDSKNYKALYVSKRIVIGTSLIVMAVGTVFTIYDFFFCEEE